MRLAESKRAFVFNEGWGTLGTLPAGDSGWDSYISNVFGYIGQGVTDVNFTGNQIISPLVVLKLSITVDWGTAYAAFTNTLPTVFVDAYLIKTNEQFVNTVAPRLSSSTEDQTIMMKPVVFAGRITGLHTLNGQSVTVVKRKRLTITPLDGAQRNTVHRVSLKKRFRRAITFETSFDASGSQTQSPYLKGYNYYWYVITAYNRTPTSGAQNINGIQTIGDRYMYFKDF